MSDGENLQSYLPDQSEFGRATDYPYCAPDGGFVLENGALRRLAEVDVDLFAKRTPVLSVGSNRAPVQLLRKFGRGATVPVTPAILKDCDVVHVATVSRYGAVPCTPQRSPGTRVTLNIAWLDRDQLQVMHKSEAIGNAYDYLRLDAGVVEHLPMPEAGGDIVGSNTDVFGYVSRKGWLEFAGDMPASLECLCAEGRVFEARGQHQAWQHLLELVAEDVPELNREMTRRAFNCLVTNSRSIRYSIDEVLREDDHSRPCEGPWSVIERDRALQSL